ncbi:aldo/keto reductase [Mycolicibacterium wolinskyi]|uniref:Aldo/keto reductase n=1 Tax=Mycolicibacterium wolinskyi TaxID=59750 RepID=A0A1X2EV58_9MYCO|nr:MULTISPECIES: aldo/keto reductase [Mycolicibacterium]MCV7286924.1 aldo/keto reductase [Mycolicibacterium wolinskyi]MCV7292417.1 aldo/keto reductase [Mycolicibacterium goodii]ORX09649.1 aldo/keto reductase [Mycolicibacterium wolinskyi]
MGTSHPGGIGTLGGHAVARIGYGAMGLGHQLPQADAVAVLRRAVALGVDHIDTASFYDDGEVNRRIHDALSPYAEDLVIVSKVGARPATGRIPLALAQHPAELRAAVELDLTQLGLDRIPVVNLRRADIGPGVIAEGDQIVDLDDQLAEMITLRDEGKIGAIGISNVDLATLRRALPSGIVCVQNAYSVLNRERESELALCAEHDIAWVPFFPLGSAFPGFPKVAENPVVQRIAGDLGASGAQVGLAWLLAHAPNTLLIAGTTSVEHLEENLRAGDISLSADHLAELDAVWAGASPHSDGVEAFLDER